MASRLRWKQAQSYEKAHWEEVSDHIQKDGRRGLTWYKWRAENLLRNIQKAFPDSTPEFTDASVLEVGSGPVGCISQLQARERVALDPLCDFFSTKPSLVEHRSPDVVYKNAQGEELPFDDGHFDMVVIENVIDHVENANGVMQQINRVLKPDGVLYLTVNLHPAWGYFLHEVVSKLRIDKGHPHTFTIPKIRSFLNRHGFQIFFDEWEDYKKCKADEWKSDSTRSKLKAVSGLSEFLFTSVSRKTNQA